MTPLSNLLTRTGWTVEVAAAGAFRAAAAPLGADVVRVAGAAVAGSPDDHRQSNSRRPIPDPVGSASVPKRTDLDQQAAG
jgi:hypothetical protein